MHFSQMCTHERCLGYWALRFDEGAYGDVPLAGSRALVTFDCPQRMIDGGWTEALYIDESVTPAQRDAIESIVTGKAGGPWEVLGRFVGRRLETRSVSITFADEGATKRGSIAGVFEAVVTQIRGRDRSKPVVFDNIFNQIHAPTQVLALGETTYDDGVIAIRTKGTHGLFSMFDWSAAAG